MSAPGEFPSEARLASTIRVVLVTVPHEAAGIALARTVVEEGLAACGNVVPGVHSVYRWEGQVQQDHEALIIFKTTDNALESLRKRVVELHSYEIPEFLVFEPKDGHLPYLQWVCGEVDMRGRS